MAAENTGANTKRRGRPENLRPPWKKGESGNPGGRPKKTLLTDAYRAVLEKPYPGDKEGRTYAEVIAERVAKEAAKKGSVHAASEIADRTEGRPPQALEVGGPGGGAIDVNVQGLPDSQLDNEIRVLFGVLGLAGAKATTPRAAKRKGSKAGKK